MVTNNIGFDLPFGLRFVLNPDEADSSISAFPISLPIGGVGVFVVI